jgi:TM2 domain-containing membrane protein YozV
VKDKNTAALLALLLGGLGFHKFYLGQTGAGIVYFIFCWTLIPAVVGFLEFIVLLAMRQTDFDRRFNNLQPVVAMSPAPAQQIVIYNQSPVHYGEPPRPATSSARETHAGVGPSDSVADELKKLNELRVAGIITEEEFTAHKQRLLS